MSRRIFSSVFVLLALAAGNFKASAQEGEYGSYAPYSIFGVGDLSGGGSAYLRSMAGAGIASRDTRYINTLNPASVTARDTLTFMVDFSLLNTNTLFKQNSSAGTLSTAKNITNIGSMAISFPLFRNTAMMVGLAPYSATGYRYSFLETDPVLIARNGNIAYSDYGQGSLYRLYGAAGHTFLRKLSVGVEVDYIFGSMEKVYSETFEKSGYNQVKDNYDMTLNSATAKFGLQYDMNLDKDWKLGLGSTLSLGSRLKGIVDYSHISLGTAENVNVGAYSDILSKSSPVRLAGEFGFGISLAKGDNFRANIDYTRSDWTKTNVDTKDGFAVNTSESPFTAGVRHAVRAGVEYTPNRNDIRYYRNRVTYRAGAYYNNEYYKLGGSEINNFGITIGATLPIFQWHHGLSFAVDLGQRGTLQNDLIRERYVRFCVGVNLSDIWFRRFKYE